MRKAIQMAKLQGFSPIIATSSLQHADYLKSIGATHVLDRSLPPADVLVELPELSGGQPIEYAFDAISAPETQHLAYDALAPGGAMITTQPFSEAILADKEKRDGGSKKVARPYATANLELIARLTEWLEKGYLVVCSGSCLRMRVRTHDAWIDFVQPNKIEVLPNGLAGIPEGLERMKQGKVSGIKLVVRPQETP